MARGGEGTPCLDPALEESPPSCNFCPGGGLGEGEPLLRPDSLKDLEEEGQGCLLQKPWILCFILQTLLCGSPMRKRRHLVVQSRGTWGGGRRTRTGLPSTTEEGEDPYPWEQISQRKSFPSKSLGAKLHPPRHRWARPNPPPGQFDA